MVTKGKVKSTGSLNGGKGGKTKMFGKSGVAPSQPQVSAPPHKQPFNKNMNKGGGSHMAKKSGVAPSTPGKVTVSRPGVGNSKGFAVQGGKKHMFGKGSSTTARQA